MQTCFLTLLCFFETKLKHVQYFNFFTDKIKMNITSIE